MSDPDYLVVSTREEECLWRKTFTAPLIYQPALLKARLMRDNPDRYFSTVYAERRLEQEGRRER